MLAARRWVLTGRVQGVGFRYFVREAAASENLRGWVANRGDGGVEVVAEGDLEALLRFERHLRRGPAGARIDDVVVHDEAASDRRRGFEIRP